jgi:hypothetical protein
MMHSFSNKIQSKSYVSVLNSAVCLHHGTDSTLVLVTSHRNCRTYLCSSKTLISTAFGTPDPVAENLHIHTTIAVN